MKHATRYGYGVGFWAGSLLLLFAIGCGGGGGSDGGGEPAAGAWTTFQPASTVLGQPGFGDRTANQGQNTPTAGTLSFPVAVSAASLWIVDAGNRRVLRYGDPLGPPPLQADLILGQPNATSNGPNLTAAGFLTPIDAHAAEGKMAVADFGGNRVLLWNTIPTTTGQAANVVVGQTDFVTDGPGTTASTMTQPTVVRLSQGRLLVADVYNHRVLVWNSVPTSNGEPADLVLGQPDFVSGTWGLSASAMREPRGIWTDGTRLVVADHVNSRVLIWNTFPVSNGQPADLVLGQPDFLSNAQTTSASGLTYPSKVDSDGTRLVVCDTGNHRVLVWNTFPTTNAQPADVVLGQGDFNHGTENDDDQDAVTDGGASARTFHAPSGVLILGSRLLVGDQLNHRVLVFETP